MRLGSVHAGSAAAGVHHQVDIARTAARHPAHMHTLACQQHQGLAELRTIGLQLLLYSPQDLWGRDHLQSSHHCCLGAADHTHVNLLVTMVVTI